MKRYLLLIALLIMLSGCTVGIYDGHGGYGAAIGVPYPHYEPYYHGGYYYYSHSHGHYYPSAPGHYYRGPEHSGYYR